MVFTPTSENSTHFIDLWHHPVIRCCAAALRDIYFGAWPAKDDTAITEEDVARWATHFAASSYGDELFATTLAIFLQASAPAALQVNLWPCPYTAVKMHAKCGIAYPATVLVESACLKESMIS